mgnify:FL=1
MTGSLAFIAGLFAGIVSWLAEKIPLVRKVPRNFVVGTLSGLPTFLICYLYFQLFPQVVLTWEGTVSLAAGLAIFHGTARPFLEDN